MKLILCAVLCLAAIGCYNHASRSKERLDAKVQAFSIQNGREPNVQELAALKMEADKEEAEARAGEIAKAKEDALAAGGAALTGNYIAAAVLAVGALATFLGLNRGKVKVPEKPAGVA